jgi:hypothetical protein
MRRRLAAIMGGEQERVFPGFEVRIKNSPE